MLELFVLVGALGGLRARAKQRKVGETKIVVIALLGWAFFLVLTVVALGPIGLLVRWLWLGGVYLSVELAHDGKKGGETWGCPECLMFNDPGTLVCLCGYENPETQ